MSLEFARSILDIEIAAIASVRDRLGAAFEEALDAICACQGRVAACGMGKAGLIGRKVSTTLASTGTPSFYLHPAEALHGDLGMLQPSDLLLVFSNSGESREVVELLPFVRMLGARVLAVTGNARSSLALHAELVLDLGELPEACPLGLAPSATTTAMLALGDALALCVMRRRGFEVDDYARLHPGGALGRKTLPVESVMRTGEAVARATEDQSVRDTLFAITQARAGAAMVVDSGECVLGIFCDGDLRRGLEGDDSFLSRRVADVMTRDCVRIAAGLRAGEALDILRERRIGEAPVVDAGGRLLGVVDLKGIVASI